ncbi:MAG: preprotein translocase subunit SecE [Bacteroidota bacterium]|nr:preprotein translocase subunit SecE [Bacteroidota bacterium]
MKIKAYIEDTYNELINKVTWPTWAELQNSAVVVMVASLIIAFVVALMDSAFRNLMQFIYGMFY